MRKRGAVLVHALFLQQSIECLSASCSVDDSAGSLPAAYLVAFYRCCVSVSVCLAMVLCMYSAMVWGWAEGGSGQARVVTEWGMMASGARSSWPHSCCGL